MQFIYLVRKLMFYVTCGVKCIFPIIYFVNYYIRIFLVVQQSNANQTYIVHILTWCILGMSKNPAYRKLIVSIIIRFNSKLLFP